MCSSYRSTSSPSEVDELKALGIPSLILFGLPFEKDEVGSGAYDRDGIVQQAIRTIKAHDPDFYVMTDVCMCEYTSHGHCGILDDTGCVINDVTLEMLADTALSHAEAGADMVAPSDMMDGRVAAIRGTLDAEGFAGVPIMSYAAKYASGYYGPFREAAESTPAFGDRRGYQMDPANAEEALREVALDIDEGADIVMVKPALAYMDIIRMVKDEFGYPDRCLQRQRRVRDGEGRGAEGLDRRGARRPRDPHRLQARRRQPHPHLSRQGRREVAAEGLVVLDAAKPRLHGC